MRHKSPATPDTFSETERAFRQGIVDLIPALLGMAKHIGQSSDLTMEADDLVQMTIQRALTRFDHWEPGSDLAGWLFVMMKNVAKNAARGEKRRRLWELRAVEEAPKVVEIERRTHDRLAIADIDRLCPHLTADEVWLLIMIYKLGYTGAEIAAKLGVSVNAVYGSLARARGRIASRFGRHKEEIA